MQCITFDFHNSSLCCLIQMNDTHNTSIGKNTPSISSPYTGIADQGLFLEIIPGLSQRGVCYNP